MQHHRAIAAAKQQQRQAAIHFIAVRTPTEAARALLSDPRVIDRGDITFLGGILARRRPIAPQDRERMVRLVAALVQVKAAA